MIKAKTLTLFDFDEEMGQQAWRSIDDVVMGGVSASKFYIAPDGVGVFEGVLSLERGGGFASVRSQPAQVDLRAYDGLKIRVRGDGKRYRLRLRADPAFEGVAYQVGFETHAGVWETVRLPFDRFHPTFRGRDVPDAPPLSLDTIMAFGWMIADKQAGPFRLEIDWIRAYANGAR